MIGFLHFYMAHDIMLVKSIINTCYMNMDFMKPYIYMTLLHENLLPFHGMNGSSGRGSAPSTPTASLAIYFIFYLTRWP